ncbi:hypothetical protein C1645_825008 [Glomus cerebriforme]|uniref:Uncharacterized protein n=1 Tax=Glomus cerebriforme TaxID=658196 RepID=A0A397SZ88_9GLOM|nr:hypothetical protein C1645_825008 [Glomus cerebriforme]
MNSEKDKQLPRLIPPSTLRRSTTLSTKENIPKSTQSTARRITQLPESNVNNTLKRPMSATSIKTPSIRASAAAKKPAERLETFTNARKGVSSNVKSKPSLVKPVPLSSLKVSNSKILQQSQSNKNLNRSISLAKNNIWSKTEGSRIKSTGKLQENKSNEPIRLFLQKSDAPTNTKLPTRLTRVNPNMNRPLRPIVTPAQKSQKSVVSGTSKINTISSTRRRQTVALKDIQTQFKPNPVSLQEILSSKTSRDVTKKRKTLAASKLGPNPSTNARKPSIGSSRSRMTYSYRVEKPRESRASIFSGALRVPRNNVKRDSRNTLIGNVAKPSRTLPTIRESSVQEKSTDKKSANPALATRGAPRFTVKPAQRISISSFRRTTTSVIGEKQTRVTGINTQQNQSVQDSTTIKERPSIQQMVHVQQMENSVRTIESLVDPMRKMNIRRYSRKSLLMNDNTSSQPINMQRHVSFTFINNASTKVVDTGVEEKEVTLKTKENDSQQWNTNISTMKCLSQIKNQVPIHLSNNDQVTSLKSAVEMRNGIESPKNDVLLALAASIPLPPSPVEDNEKVDITRESSNINNNFSSDVEKARLYEELEELEKQLEQEISEDMSEIL